MKSLLRAVCAASCLVALVPAPVRAAGQAIDHGRFKLFVGDRPLGVETFDYQRASDSLLVTAEVYQTYHSQEGVDTLFKRMTLAVSAFDLGLYQYQSAQEARGHKVLRSLVAHDSTLSSFHQYDQAGEGNIYALPPGHVFVLDGGMFTLFDVITRSLAGQTFDKRPINIVALGPRDSVMEASVRDMGQDTLRWGGRPVRTRRLEFSDGSIRYLVWADDEGRMLKMTQPENKVRVEREAAAIKPRGKRPPGR